MKNINPTGAGVALSTYSKIYPQKESYDGYFLYHLARPEKFKQDYKSIKPASHLVYYTACCLQDYLSPASLFLDPDRTGVLIDTMKEGALTKELKEYFSSNLVSPIYCFEYNNEKELPARSFENLHVDFMDSYRKFMPKSFELANDTSRAFVNLLESTKLGIFNDKELTTSVQLYIDELGNVYIYFKTQTIIGRAAWATENVSDVLMVFNYNACTFNIYADKEDKVPSEHLRDIIQTGLGVTKDKLLNKRAEKYMQNQKVIRRVTNKLGHMIYWPFLFSMMEKDGSIFDFGPFMEDFQVVSLVSSSIEELLEDFEETLDWNNGFTVSGFPKGYKQHPPDGSLNDLTDSFRSIIKIKYTKRTH